MEEPELLWQRIERLRKQHNLSIAELARVSRTDRSHLRRALDGVVGLGHEKLQRIAARFGLTMDQLLEGAETSAPDPVLSLPSHDQHALQIYRSLLELDPLTCKRWLAFAEMAIKSDQIRQYLRAVSYGAYEMFRAEGRADTKDQSSVSPSHAETK